MAVYDFRILLETVGGAKYSYRSSSFVNTENDLVLSASQVYNRITGSTSCSYQNKKIFDGSEKTGVYFHTNTFLSTSLTASANEETNIKPSGSSQGAIVFTALDEEYDRLKRYKFFGEKVCSTLGIPENQWIFVDQFRLASDDEANYIEGNINAKNIYIGDDLSFSNSSTINTDIPIFIDTGSDRHIKFIDERGLGSVPFSLGYDKDEDIYEINGDPDQNKLFHIKDVNKLTMPQNSSISASTTSGITILSDLLTTKTNKSLFDHKYIVANAVGGLFETNVSQNTEKFMIYTKNNCDIEIRTNGFNDAIYIDNSEDAVGIGTNSPTHTLSVLGEISASGLVIAGNISASGAITAKEYYVDIVSSSVAFSEGSTQFGNSLDDTHIFTGSINISGSTTFVNSITASGNISSSGTGTFGDLSLPDDGVLNVGTGNDLQIKHNGSNSFITDTGTGDLYIRAADNLRIQATSTNEDMIKAIKDGGVELYHNNVKKLETTAGGTNVVGHITASGNISSSGNITSSGLYTSGNISASGFISAQTVEIDGGRIAYNMNIPGAAEYPLNYAFRDGGIYANGNITASGHISASSTSTGSFGRLDLAGGVIDLKNQGAQSQIKMYCEDANQHFQTIQSAPHSDGASNTLTLPSVGTVFATTDGTQTLTNKTLTTPTINNITTFTANGNLDIGAHDFRAATLTADGLTSGRVVFAGTNGVLSDDGDFTFATDTLTVTKIANVNSTTNITASTNISCSGNLIANELILAGGTFTSSSLAAGGSGGGGGISFDGSTANGVTTFKDSDEVTVEPNLTFDGTTLITAGNLSASGNFQIMQSSSIHFNHFNTGSNPLGQVYNVAGQAQGDIVKFGGGSTSSGKLYYLNTSGTWTLANATDNSAGSNELLAISLGSSPIVDGMLIRGLVRLGSLSTIGTAVFMGTSNGAISQTAPSSNDNVVRIIGYCTNSTLNQIYFNPDSTWVKVTA